MSLRLTLLRFFPYSARTPLCSLVVLAVGFLLPTPMKAERRPNILVVLADDQGWGDLSLNGNTNLHTPNIDRLAHDGATLDRFYVCPVCSPTRAEFLTGRYHPRCGVYSTSAGGERIDLDEITIAQTFQVAGYATGAFGKWHNGMQPPYHPNARGFDEFYGFCSGHWGDYFSPMLEHNGDLVRGDGFVVDDFTNRAIQFIESHKHEPFFCYVPYNTPHSPMQVPDRWWNDFRDKRLDLHNREPSREDVPHIRAALAMCENIDWNVGRLIEKLDQLGLTRDTMVVYFSDNGPNGVRWNGGMKGRKGSTDEGGVRSPLVMRWPAKIPAGRRITTVSAAIDLLPTLADLAGVPVASRKKLDGMSLAPTILRSESTPVSDRILFSHWRDRISARSQRFRLDHQGSLFDLASDPGQRTDVSDTFPEETKRLAAAITNWKADVFADGRSDRPFPLGHPDFLNTQMPARDAVPHGHIERSNRFPNCSYFRSWTSVDDRITWDVEVGASGRYDVSLYYTCRASDVGSTVELSLGDCRTSSKIVKANDPPLLGAEHDRTKRIESYVKDFRPMDLGTLNLVKGQRGELTLRATEIPGAEAMEFRLLVFRRQRDHQP